MSGLGLGVAAAEEGAKLSGVPDLLKRIPWQVWAGLGIALAAFLLVHDRNHWKSVATERQAEVVNYRRQLDSISTAKNVQQQVTTKTVEKVIQGQTQIRTVVQHIHDAPDPAQCKTPDLPELRNVL